MKSKLWIAILALPFMAGAQEIVEKDSTTVTVLNEAALKAYRLENPSFIKVSNNYTEQVAQPKNVAGLFNDINGFSIIKRGNYAMDPAFRGSQYEQINVQYDGAVKVMNACPNRMDPITSHIAPEEIERIEIIKGPYSVRYGASFAGVVNLVTRNPSKGKKGWQGSVASGYESNGDAYVGMARLHYVGNQFDLGGHFGYRDYNDYKDGDGVKIPSAFKSTDYGLNFGWNINEHNRLELGWKQSFGRDVLHAGLPMDTDYDDSSIANLTYKWEPKKEVIQSLEIKTYYSYVDHLMTNTLRPSFHMMEMDSWVESTTAGVKAELEWKTSDKIRFYSGVDYTHIGRDGNRKSLMKMMNGEPVPNPMWMESSIWQDSFIDDWGVFTEAKWKFAPTYLLTAGLRYDRVISDIREPEADFEALYDLKKRNEDNLSGTVSLRKAISSRFFVEFAYGRGVRSANMIERFIDRFNVGQDSYSYIGNPNLKAEINNQFEIGLNGYKNLGGFFNILHFEGAVYYSLLDNYISAVIDNQMGDNIKVFQNTDKAYKTGVDVSLKLDFAQNYYFKTDFSYVYAKNKDLDESLPLIAPFTTTLKLGYDSPKFWGNVQYNIVAAQNELAHSFGEVKTPAYQTMDIRLGYKPVPKLSIGLAALNVFDKTYHDHLNFAFRNQADFGAVPINEPGINFTTFVQYSF